MQASCSGTSSLHAARRLQRGALRLASPLSWRRGAARRQPVAAAAAPQPQQGWGRYILENGLVDYYEVLGVDDDASTSEVKRAYRALAKECHPDYLGDTGHNICILLNEAYEVLSSEEARMAYDARLAMALQDEEDNYTGQPLSKWMPTAKPKMAKNKDPNERRAVFVDENACIGCKQCVWQASATFRMMTDIHGRSRVFAQWLDTEEKIQASIDSCPVSCIHWVDKDQLPALEYVMQVKMTDRTNVGVMMAGQGAVRDVWAATEQFLKERKRKAEARARAARAYSPAQEAARREAAEALMQQNLGVFASILGSVFPGINGATAPGAAAGEATGVGRRKRADGTRWDQRGAAAAAAADANTVVFDSIAGSSVDYEGVPPERAMVLARVAAEPQPAAARRRR